MAICMQNSCGRLRRCRTSTQSRARIGKESKDLCWLELRRLNVKEMILRGEKGMCGGKPERRYGSPVIAQDLKFFLLVFANTVQNTKSRRLEDELEQAVAKSEDATHELQSQKSQLASLRERLKRSEADLTAARQDLLMEREASETRQARHTDDLSARTPETAHQLFRTESPPIIMTSHRKAPVSERPSPHSGRRIHGLAISGTGNPTLERPVSRRSSTQPFQSFASELRPSSSSRRESLPFVPQVSVNGSMPESPSVPPSTNQEDFFEEGARTPATPERTVNDMISGSTAGAGPSVQLVERMSAAVRRLESEKAASREEVGRLCGQRDEAREQVVSLMQEVEGKRAADERARGLEKEVRAIEERYLTTLEMLGEKSEAVEELKADVVDLKELYRELVEKTMR